MINTYQILNINLNNYKYNNFYHFYLLLSVFQMNKLDNLFHHKSILNLNQIVFQYNHKIII